MLLSGVFPCIILGTKGHMSQTTDESCFVILINFINVIDCIYYVYNACLNLIKIFWRISFLDCPSYFITVLIHVAFLFSTSLSRWSKQQSRWDPHSLSQLCTARKRLIQNIIAKHLCSICQKIDKACLLFRNHNKFHWCSGITYGKCSKINNKRISLISMAWFDSYSFKI
jgi:hypothetical protein